MPIEFRAETKPSAALCREVANLAPANPFYTFECLESQRAVGLRPWLLLLCENGRLVSGCAALLRTGFLTRSLEFESLPAIPDADVFWKGLQRSCLKSVMRSQEWDPSERHER